MKEGKVWEELTNFDSDDLWSERGASSRLALPFPTARVSTRMRVKPHARETVAQFVCARFARVLCGTFSAGARSAKVVALRSVGSAAAPDNLRSQSRH